MAHNFGLNAIVAFAAALWALLLILQGSVLPGAWWKPFSTVVGAVVLLLSFFERWGWRLHLLHPWLVNVPDLRGIWEGRLISQWVNPESGETSGPIPAYLAVRQTLSMIHVRLLTEESSSVLLSGKISREPDGELVLIGTYRNTPRLARRGESPIHYGGLLLEIAGPSRGPLHLRGEYWTDRRTQGELKFDWMSRGNASDFASAKALVRKDECDK